MSLNKQKCRQRDFFAWIEVTGKCNLRCPYCYATSALSKDKREFKDEELFTLLKDLKKSGIIGVVLSGGEPVLKNHIEDFLEFGAKTLGLKMMLVSNGTVIPEALLQCLKKNKIPVQLSLDSVDYETFFKSRGVAALSQVMKNIDILLNRGVDVTLSSTLTKINYRKIMGLVEYAKDKNIQNVHIGEFIPFGRGGLNRDIFLSQSQHYRILKKLYDYQIENFLFVSIDIVENFLYPLVFKQKRKYYCNPSLQIDNKGGIEYCINMPSATKQNVLTDGAAKTILKMKEDYDSFLISTKDIPSCKECPNANICSGGCRAIPFNFYKGKGSLTKRHPYCRSYMQIMGQIRRDIRSGKLDEYFDFLNRSIPADQRNLKRIF